MIWLLLACAADPAVVTSGVDTGTTTDDMDPWAFESATTCAACHPNQTAEWQQSMHAYAAKSPVFDAMAQKAYRDTSGEIGTFCTGCHSPQGTAQGEPGTTTAAERSALSREGITCDVCHTAQGHNGTIGNTSLDLHPGGPKQGPFDDPASAMHAAEQSAFVSSPELCGSCHDVFAFPGLRIEEAYTEYLDSPAVDAGVRCQDCHMGPEPGVVSERPWGPAAVEAGVTYPDRELSSHRFVGPDYSLIDNFPYEDDLDASAAAQLEYLDRVQGLLENAVRISALEVSAPPTGELVIALTLESLVTGHRVPTGFTSERQLWINLTVTDNDGDVVFVTGDLDDNGDLRDAHSDAVQLGEVPLDEALVNLQSKNMKRTWDFDDNGHNGAGELPPEEAVFPFEADWIEKYSLEPLEQRRLLWTVDAGPGTYEISARVYYRNLPPYLLRALGQDELVPRLQIFELDGTEESVTVGAPGISD